MTDYFVCGLRVRCELQLPGILNSGTSDNEVDVQVVRAQVPLPYVDVDNQPSNWRIDGAHVLFRVPGLVRFLIADGREIFFALEASGRDEDVVPFLLSTALGILLHQRQLLVLHASAVLLEGQAIAICGPSGAGKSTLAAALCKAGCSFFSDDISVIHPAAEGPPRVVPDGRQHRLWANSVEHLVLAEYQGPAVRAQVQKFHVEPVRSGDARSAPLRAIVVLREASIEHPAGVVPLSPADAIALLRNDVFRGMIASRLGHDAQLFAQIAGLLPHVQMLRLNRGASFSSLADNVQSLLGELRH